MRKLVLQQYEVVPIDAVHPHPLNARKGVESLIRESIDELGFYGALRVQRSTGHILAGNHAWKSAKAMGYKEIPVLWLDVEDQVALKILAADNRIADLAEYEEHQRLKLLNEINVLGDFTGTGYDEAYFNQAIAEFGQQVLDAAQESDVQQDVVVAAVGAMPTESSSSSTSADKNLCPSCGRKMPRPRKKRK